MVPFAPNRAVYIRAHVRMAVIVAVVVPAVMWLAGMKDVAWTGLIAAPLAIGFRGWFLMSEVLEEGWTLSATTLAGPAGRTVRLNEIAKFNTLANTVQIVTQSGDKHLIKYQADPHSVIADIEAARTRARQDAP